MTTRAPAVLIKGHDCSLYLKFSSILGLCDPILPRLCRSRTLYFEISKELSRHIWNHKGKFLCDESFQLNAFHVFATAVKLIHIASIVQLWTGDGIKADEFPVKFQGGSFSIKKLILQIFDLNTGLIEHEI